VRDVEAHITGAVWKIECQVGQQIAEGDTLVILESMKMEMPVEAEDDGTVTQIVCQEGQSVSEGDTIRRPRVTGKSNRRLTPPPPS